jgi:hypothetical protein
MTKVSAQKARLLTGHVVYTGKVTVYDDDMYLFTKWTNITRLTKEDAIHDAKQLEQDMLNIGR